jgi:hypothetical protein
MKLLSMLTKNRVPQLVILICAIEISIYLWSVWTATFDLDNFFGIEPEFIFDKCARLAGRVSSVLILFTLMMVGYYGLKKMNRKKNRS